MIQVLFMRAQRLFRKVVGRPRLDWVLFGLLLLLMAIGLGTLYSASDLSVDFVMGQSLRMLMGLVMMLILSRVPPSMLRTWTPWLYVGSTGLLLVVMFVGEGKGAIRWLDLGFMRFQPSELLKLSVPMMVAWYLHPRRLPPSWPDLAAAMLLLAVPALLIAEQPDLGTALLVASAGLSVVFLAGVQWWRIGAAAAIFLASLPVAWHYLHDYQRQRVMTLLNPASDPLGSGWHIIQSKIAVGSGGLLGKGWHQGTQSRLEFLPEHTTDFILAVFAEEFGLVGVLCLFALYAVIIGRCLWIASQARDTWSRLVGGTIALSFFVYVAVNSGMVAGVLPVVGVPLPLVSYGGTSAVSLLTSFGVLMSIHAHRKLTADLQ